MCEYKPTHDACAAAYVGGELGATSLLPLLPPPVLDLQMRLGEGTGAILMVGLLRSAVALLGMASLADALK